jgi:pyruvate,water dikinase
MPDDFMEGFRDPCRRVEEDPGLGPDEALLRLLLPANPLAPIGHFALLVNGSAIRFAPWMAALRGMLRRWAPEVGDDALTLLCSGSEGVLSVEMGRSLWALAAEARRVPGVAELIVADPPDEALARLRAEPVAAGFLAQLEAFLAIHGHRGIKEFELQSARWAENPAPVLGMIRNYLSFGSDAARPDDKAARTRAEVEQAVRRSLLARPLGRLRWRLVRLAAERVRCYLKLRENSRFYHIMAFGVARKKILEIEAQLLRSGRLRCKDDVFLLRLSELHALRSGRLGWLDLEDRVRERRLEQARLAQITPPRTIGIASRQRGSGEEVSDASCLRGQGASPGGYEGVARVILDPSIDVALRPGEVLVAPYTDPAWTPLFLSAGAAVVEVGSYLSHAGTIAREFGMPCVVDVPDCTRRIQTGARVAVDGDRGHVRILDDQECKP